MSDDLSYDQLLKSIESRIIDAMHIAVDRNYRDLEDLALVRNTVNRIIKNEAEPF